MPLAFQLILERQKHELTLSKTRPSLKDRTQAIQTSRLLLLSLIKPCCSSNSCKPTNWRTQDWCSTAQPSQHNSLFLVCRCRCLRNVQRSKILPKWQAWCSNQMEWPPSYWDSKIKWTSFKTRYWRFLKRLISEWTQSILNSESSEKQSNERLYKVMMMRK